MNDGKQRKNLSNRVGWELSDLKIAAASKASGHRKQDLLVDPARFHC